MFRLRLVRNRQLLSGDKLETLKHCQRRRQFTDVILICEDKYYFAHKLMLASDDKYNEVSNIFLPNAAPHDVENLISLIYESEVWLPRNEIQGLLMVCKSMGVDQFEPHGEVDIPQELLYKRVTTPRPSSDAPFKESRASNAKASTARVPPKMNTPSVSRNDQENDVGVASSRFVTPAPRMNSNASISKSSMSTLPSSIASSSNGSSRKKKRVLNSTLQSRTSYAESNLSSRPETLRKQDSDLLNRNIFALDDSCLEFEKSPDQTFTVESPLPPGGMFESLRPKKNVSIRIGSPNSSAAMKSSAAEKSGSNTLVWKTRQRRKDTPMPYKILSSTLISEEDSSDSSNSTAWSEAPVEQSSDAGENASATLEANSSATSPECYTRKTIGLRSSKKGADSSPVVGVTPAPAAVAPVPKAVKRVSWKIPRKPKRRAGKVAVENERAARAPRAAKLKAQALLGVKGKSC